MFSPKNVFNTVLSGLKIPAKYVCKQEVVMYHKTTLKALMSQDLPNLTFQRKLCYTTNIREVKALYRLLNKEIFNNRLNMPKIHVRSRLRGFWGECLGADTPYSNKKSRCLITIADRWYCRQWLIITLAHEMCHQYEWDIISKHREREGLPPIMSHGPTFFRWRDKLNKKGIPLRRMMDNDKWFATQQFLKC